MSAEVTTNTGDVQATDSHTTTTANSSSDIKHDTKESSGNIESNTIEGADKEAKINDQESADQKNDSLNLSTAFTISFEDDTTSGNNASSKKLFGIRDSIRKFAPPKPNTIERPREKKNDSLNQDNSYMSIESAPGGYSKQSPTATFRRDVGNASFRSSSRRSDTSSKSSNVSESAAFLIDRMLNNNSGNSSSKQGGFESLSSIYLDSQNKARSKHYQRGQTFTPTTNSSPKRGKNHNNDHHHQLSSELDGVLDDEIDFCEDRSDNGTYIVGSDPESDAARKRIDELFGVVKAAEASVAAAAAAAKQKARAPLAARPSRPAEKKTNQQHQLSRERQEHINRLAIGRNSSRSSSSSRQELANCEAHQQEKHRPRSATRQQRNSSCDRTHSKLPTAQRGHRHNQQHHHPHRRSASQSSRQSSNRDASEPDDTRSSRSSLHNNDITDSLANQENMQPSMKFNRAFALRRARLGLGEPQRASGVGGCKSGSMESDGAASSLTSSPRRTLNNNGSVYGRYNLNTNAAGCGVNPSNTTTTTTTTTTGSNLSRNDGGRFSLRMRNNVTSGRLTSGLRSSNQSGNNQTGIIDSYSGKVSSTANQASGKAPTSTIGNSPMVTTRTSATAATVIKSSNMMPYTSGDELDRASLTLSPSRNRPSYTKLSAQAMAPATVTKIQQSSHSQMSHNDISPEWDLIDSDNRLNYSLCIDSTSTSMMDQQQQQLQERFNRMCQSTARHGSSSAMTNIQHQSNHHHHQQQQPPLGALDCLVISAISSLSLKVRGSVCDLMVDHAKRLPGDNETRLIVEEILPQLTANTTRPKSPTSIEEIDQSVYFDLAQTLKNLKKLEQMVDVMKMISSQLPTVTIGGEGSSCFTSMDKDTGDNSASKSSSTSLSGGGAGVANLPASSSSVRLGEGSTATMGKSIEADSNTNSEATSLSPV